MKKNIYLIYGGKSVEHDISVITAINALENIDTQEYNILPIYITKQGNWVVPYDYENINTYKNFDEKKAKQIIINFGKKQIYQKGFVNRLYQADIALLCTHGTYVEDGCLQGVLESLNVAYTGSGVCASAVGMNKKQMKNIFTSCAFPCVKYECLNKKFIEQNKNYLVEISDKLGFPLIVKPANLGSSIGISKCENQNQLNTAVEIAFSFDCEIIIEEAVQNLREFNCAVLGDESNVITSNIEEPVGWEDFLNFDEKYIKNNKNKRKNACIDNELKNQITELAKNVFINLGCSGVARVDFLFDDKNKILYVNEINTIPGSLSNYLFDNYSYNQLINRLIKLAVKKQSNKNQLIFDYNSSALEINCGKK